MQNNNLTLRERAALVHDMTSTGHLNKELLTRWQKQTPFKDASIFSERLSAAGLSRDVFEAAISLDLEHILPEGNARSDVVVAYRQDLSKHPDWSDVLFSIKPHKAEGLEAFSALVGPLIVAALRRVEVRTQTLSETTPIEPTTLCYSASQYLVGKIARITQRTLLRELHKLRLSGRLKGKTSEDRFAFFCMLLTKEDYAAQLLHAYPVLARQLVQSISQWEISFLELIERYATDFHSLQTAFGTRQILGDLINVTLEAGDQHGGGRSVSILHFSTNQKIVYKPRSLAVDLAFRQLLEWMHEKGFPIELLAPKVLDQGDYGWAEFIEAAGCGSEADVQAFFERQGSFLALFYLLCANDFHHENIIACGAHPIPVDLETLLQPDLTLVGLSGGLATSGNEIYNTVLNAGLLPQRIWGNKDEEAGIDLSGMSAEGELSPVKSLMLENIGTDQMRLVRKRVPVPPGDHMVTLAGAPVAVEGYVTEIISGFTQTHEFLAAQSRALLAKRGPLEAFENVETRVILRATFYYALLLSDSFHPDVMSDGLERDLFFDRLWLEVPSRKLLSKVVEAERQDMWLNDIPRFMMKPGKPHLWTASKEKIANVWQQTPIDLMREKLKSFGPKDRLRQAWLAEKTLGTLALRKSTGGYRDYKVSYGSAPLSTEAILSEAKNVADRLCDLSFSAADGSVAWMTCSPAGTRQWVYQEMENDLYNGLPGLCLFFAYLASATGEDRYSDISKGAWKTVARHAQTPAPYSNKPGAFTGWGGLLYAAHHLSCLWSDKKILDDILCRLPKPECLLAADQEFDLIGGSAGFVASALNLVEAGYSELIDHCTACGDHLLKTAIETPDGIGWRLDAAGNEPLGGFSHGAAGIAWSLLRLAKVTNEKRFRDAAMKALRYDRSLYSSHEGNWRDVREGMRPGETELTDSHFVVAWCHGAPGIGLSRLLLKDILEDSLLDDEIALAFAKTLSSGFGSNHSLCHGDLGNMEFLTKAAKAGLGGMPVAECDKLIAGIVASGQENGWRCGFPPGTEPLGLMVGLAGIGYGLLKLAKWDLLPSILSLEPPHNSLSTHAPK